MQVFESSVGDFLSVDHIVYEVCKAPSCSCFGCSFFIDSDNECSVRNLRFEPCCAESRLDGQDVIFVKVGELDDKLFIV